MLKGSILYILCRLAFLTDGLARVYSLMGFGYLQNLVFKGFQLNTVRPNNRKIYTLYPSHKIRTSFNDIHFN